MSDQKNIRTVLYGLRRTKDRVKYLQENETPQLRKMFKANFDKRIKFKVPEGVPNIDIEYKEKYNLEQVVDQLYLIIEGATNLKTMQCERKFIDWYSGLPKKERDILLLVKDKNLQKSFSFITVDLIKEAFPDSQIQV